MVDWTRLRKTLCMNRNVGMLFELNFFIVWLQKSDQIPLLRLFSIFSATNFKIQTFLRQKCRTVCCLEFDFVFLESTPKLYLIPCSIFCNFFKFFIKYDGKAECLEKWDNFWDGNFFVLTLRCTTLYLKVTTKW